MAASSHENFSSESIFIKNAVVFEEQLKERLNWNKQTWLASGESGTKLHKLSNSLHYWKSKLRPALEDTSIVVTLFNQAKDVRMDLLNIISVIEALDESFQVKGVATFRNPRHICLYFQSKEVRDRVKELFRIIDDSFVVYMSWALDNEINVHTLKVHWLPMTFDINMIKQELVKYVECIEQERKKLVFMSGRDMPLGKIEFKVKLRKDVTADKIPHVMEIGKMEALITVAGRQSLCLNCDCLGHISKDCKLRFCSVCRILKPKNHECESDRATRSYAQTVKVSLTEYGDHPKEWGDDTVVFERPTLNADKLLLSNKIAVLENQVKEMQSSQETADLSRKEKKRKVDNVDSSADENIAEDFDDNQSSNYSSDIEFFSVNKEEQAKIKSDEVKNKNIRSRKKKIRNKNKTSKDIETTTLENKNIGESFDPETIFRSYGKPNPNNARKKELERKFDKINEVREFVFKD